ncbi:MAG: Ltp family lipoprotein [Candidatus Saccharibacteria bacterium]|nr:Ltp family lipoprotein [Candidatus Saccharibacteria bacterium]
MDTISNNSFNNKNSHTHKDSKPIYKKVWFWVIIILVLITIGGAGSSQNKSDAGSTSNSQNNGQKVSSSGKKVKVIDFSQMNDTDIVKWCGDNGLSGKIERQYSDAVPKDGYISQSISANSETNEGSTVVVYRSLGKEPTAEQKNALKQAGTYANRMHMSKQALYDQLVSEYGGQFSADAAQYAIDNVETDWKGNALESARTYYNQMSMSKNAIYDQLISPYGDKFTAEEAQYAIDSLQ